MCQWADTLPGCLSMLYHWRRGAPVVLRFSRIQPMKRHKHNTALMQRICNDVARISNKAIRMEIYPKACMARCQQIDHCIYIQTIKCLQMDQFIYLDACLTALTHYSWDQTKKSALAKSEASKVNGEKNTHYSVHQNRLRTTLFNWPRMSCGSLRRIYITDTLMQISKDEIPKEHWGYSVHNGWC